MPVKITFACLWAFCFVLTVEKGFAANEIPRPEHPRPDAYRPNWLNLNGEWQFEIDRKNDGDSRGLISGTDLESKIIVPFPPESKASGLNLGNSDKFKNAWYRLRFTLPNTMNGKRILLHFGAVDYQTWAYINGQLVGTHAGGSASFSFDATADLHAGQNEIVVKVLHDMDNDTEPKGKQSKGKSEGVLYTRTTGIWQTVWLEAVGTTYIKNISLVPDPDHSRVLIRAEVDGPDEGLTLTAQAFAAGKQVGTESAPGVGKNVALVLNLSEKNLWEPGSPFLYDLALTLSKGTGQVDTLQSYFGLRKVIVQGRRILINGKSIFMRTILDQGFFPDGIWAAPTDNDLKHDIEMGQAAGFNGARMHQKVFDPRYLYWADKLGYLVWGEFPNWGYDYKPKGYAPYLNEWIEVLLQNRNHPGIIGWIPFNETSDSAVELQQLVWNVTRAVDPTRPVIETSGWHHHIPNPEILDVHDYEPDREKLRAHWVNFFSNTVQSPSLPSRYGMAPATGPVDLGIPFWLSEFGGIGWASEGGWSYGSGPKSLDEFYARYKGLVDAQLDNPNLFGFCYTQLTDVEQEKNGLYYYDRRAKFDLAKLHEITSRQAAYERGDPQAPRPPLPGPSNWRVLVASARDKEAKPWHYTTDGAGDQWMNPDFDDSAWKSARAPFGHDAPGVQTPWTGSDLYIRQTFEYQGNLPVAAAIVISHDDDAEVYINGKKVLTLAGHKDYDIYPLLEEVKKSLHRGANIIAVHTHQLTGGQFIDLALLVQ